MINCLKITGQDIQVAHPEVSVRDQNSAGNFIYLHTDRSYYIPGEHISFKAYILDNRDNWSDKISDTLNVVLLDQEGIEVSKEEIPLNNSLISGNIELPDFLSEGNYILIAYTRSMYNLSTEKIFSKIIEIRNSLEINLITDLSLKDTLYEPGSLLTVQIKFSGKDNQPVPASFNYQLTGKSGEILRGKNKANNDGTASLSFKLPEFDNKETMKLLVVPSYKRVKSITGLVIPTRYNFAEVEMGRRINLPANESNHLNIRLSTVRLSDNEGDKVRVDIYVTDDKGTPVMTNLSVSASNLIPHQLPFENDNIVIYSKRKGNQTAFSTETDLRKYFADYLLQTTQFPGRPYIVQEKNDTKKLQRKKQLVSQNSQNGYSIDRNIFDILMQIKPYHLENGKIMFGIGTLNSLNSLEGALIVVDGIKMGTDASILNSIPVQDIARINVSTNAMEIQRYSAMNSIGIIEISMKKGKAPVKNEESTWKTNSSTLFWEPDLITDSSGKASVSFYNINKSTKVLISVDGIAANGLYGSGSAQYTVK